jgi:hypothetical protein
LENSKKITLPSGAELLITLAPFSDSKALYQAILEEVKSMQLHSTQEIDVNLFKDLFCAGFSSKKIEAALYKCFERCLYGDLKINADSFEKAEARQDYMKVCVEVAKENVLPFVKGLSVEFSTVFQAIVGDLK